MFSTVSSLVLGKFIVLLMAKLVLNKVSIASYRENIFLSKLCLTGAYLLLDIGWFRPYYIIYVSTIPSILYIVRSRLSSVIPYSSLYSNLGTCYSHIQLRELLGYLQ